MDNYITQFSVPLDKIPEAKKWKVGGHYQLTAHVEQTGVNKERHYGEGPSIGLTGKASKPKYRTEVRFKVHDVTSAKSKALRTKTK